MREDEDSGTALWPFFRYNYMAEVERLDDAGIALRSSCLSNYKGKVGKLDESVLALRPFCLYNWDTGDVKNFVFLD